LYTNNKCERDACWPFHKARRGGVPGALKIIAFQGVSLQIFARDLQINIAGELWSPKGFKFQVIQKK